MKKTKPELLLLFLFFMCILSLTAVSGSEPSLRHKQFIWNTSKVNILIIPAGYEIKPAAHNPGKTLPDWVKVNNSLAGINGGFFNNSDGFPVSHVFVDSVQVTDPHKNKALISNPSLKPVIYKIVDKRVELRVLADKQGKKSLDICPHDSSVPEGYRLLHSLQAGPELLPVNGLEKEGFISLDDKGRVTRDGIGAFSKAARSALGITDKGELILVAVEGNYKGKTGVTVYQLAELMKSLKVKKAMALDGGSSTSLTWKEGNKYKTFTGNGMPPVKVNSVLLVYPPGF